MRKRQAPIVAVLSASLAFGGIPAIALAETNETPMTAQNVSEDGTQTEGIENTSSHDEDVAYAVKVENQDYTTQGDITKQGSGNVNTAHAFEVENTPNAPNTTNVTVGGKVVSEGGGTGGDAYGVHVRHGSSGDGTVSVGGSVEAKGSGIATGIATHITNDGTLTVNVKGDVKATSANGAEGSTVDWPIGIHMVGGNYGTTNVNVGGNVTAALARESGASSTGIFINNLSDASVRVDGTITADKGIVLMKSSYNPIPNPITHQVDAKKTFTVWKINANTIATVGEREDNAWNEDTEKTADLKKSINYIIKVDPNSQVARSGITSGGNALMDAIAQKANNGVLRFKVAVPEGYKIKYVEGYRSNDSDGSGKLMAEANQLLTYDSATGEYVLVIRDGGGINLFVELEKIASYEGKDPDKKQDDPENNDPTKGDPTKGDQKPGQKATPLKKAPSPTTEKAQADSAQTRLANTGAAAKTTSVLPATSDPMSMASVAALAIAGASALVLGKKKADN